MDPAMALVLALSLTVPRLTVPDSPLRLQRSFCTSACTSSLKTCQGGSEARLQARPRSSSTSGLTHLFR